MLKKLGLLEFFEIQILDIVKIADLKLYINRLNNNIIDPRSDYEYQVYDSKVCIEDSTSECDLK